MSGAARKRPEMILANSPAEETDGSAPADQEIRRAEETDVSEPTAPEPRSFTPAEVAERVYQLMRDELAIERERRGWER